MTDLISRQDAKAVLEGLTEAQLYELRQVRDEDQGALARGDQAGLCEAGLAMPPSNCMGFYMLSHLGLQVRALIEEQKV